MGDFDSLDRDLVTCGVKAWPGPLCRPSVMEIPACFLIASVIDQNDGAVLPFYLPVDTPLPPLPEFSIVRSTPLQGNIGILVEPWQLPHRERFRTFTVLDR